MKCVCECVCVGDHVCIYLLFASLYFCICVHVQHHHALCYTIPLLFDLATLASRCSLVSVTLRWTDIGPAAQQK